MSWNTGDWLVYLEDSYRESSEQLAYNKWKASFRNKNSDNPRITSSSSSSWNRLDNDHRGLPRALQLNSSEILRTVLLRKTNFGFVLTGRSDNKYEEKSIEAILAVCRTLQYPEPSKEDILWLMN